MHTHSQGPEPTVVPIWHFDESERLCVLCRGTTFLMYGCKTWFTYGTLVALPYWIHGCLGSRITTELVIWAMLTSEIKRRVLIHRIFYWNLSSSLYLAGWGSRCILHICLPPPCSIFRFSHGIEVTWRSLDDVSAWNWNIYGGFM